MLNQKHAVAKARCLAEVFVRWPRWLPRVRRATSGDGRCPNPAWQPAPEARRGPARQNRADGDRSPCPVDTPTTWLQTMSRTRLPQGAHFRL